SSNGYGGLTISSQSVASPRTPLTAIVTYGGCTLSRIPGTPGIGLGTRRSSRWIGLRSCNNIALCRTS
ncbi:hypothetical protein JG687_00011936, partial [Phytophthora cactorum]